MRTLLLLGLAALAIATTNRIPNPRWLEEIIPDYQVKDTKFGAQREYQFRYEGQLSTGIPQSSKQHSATRIQAVCSVEFKTNTQCLLQCTHIRMGKLNQKVVEPRKLIPFAAFQEVQIESELKQQLHAPVKFTYQRGLISDIVFDGIEQPWSANIKRGILNLLNVNIVQHGRTDRTEDSVLRNEVVQSENKENDYFTAVEKTLEGECECDYTVTNKHSRYSQSPVLNVTKSINFEKCRRRPDIKYNYRFSTPCPTCEKSYQNEEKLVRSSTVIKYHITGTPEQFLINRATCESQYNYVPMTEKANVITTYVKQKLILVRTGPASNGIKEPSNPVPSDSQLVFTPDWDILKEKFFQEGEQTFHQQTPYSEVKNKVEFVGQILRRLVRCISESVDECAPRQFVRLVKILRMCKLEELKEVHNSFYKTTPSSFTPEDHKKIKDLLVDALAIAGTKDSVTHLVNQIKKREIQPIKAALAIKNLINVRVPSQQIIDQLVQLSETEVCKRNPFLRQSVVLTSGSLIHALCGDHEDKLAREFKKHPLCPRTLKQEYVEQLFNMLRKAQTTPEKILSLKTISNAGLDLSVFKLEQIIKNEGPQAPHHTITRLEAILALRRLRGTMQRKIQKILMPVFLNQREVNEIRMAAVYQIMQTLPERPTLDQISRQLYNERSRQVGSFVFTQLRTLANSTNPCEKRVAEDLKLSLRHAKYQPFARHSGSSKLLQLHSYSHKYDRGVGLDLGLVMSSRSYLPRIMAATVNYNTHSQWMKHLLSIGVVQKGADRWIRQLYGKSGYLEREFDEVLSRSPRSIKTQSPKNELKRIFEKLNIAERYSSEQDAFVMPYLKMKDNDMGFLPISSEAIPEYISEMVRNDRLDINTIERTLEQGINMDFYQAFMLHEQSRKIPTSMGLPLRTSLKMPVIVRINGQIKGQMEPNNKLRMVKLIVNVKPSMALGMSVSMSSWSPVVNSGLKVIGKLHLYTPIHCEAKVDARKNPVDTELKCNPHRNPYQMVKAETRPITYTYVWPKSLETWQEPEERTIMGEEWTRVNTFDHQFGEKALGIKVRTHGRWHRTPKKSVSGTPFCPFSGPNKLQVTIEPGHNMPQEVVVKITGKLFKQMKQSMKPKFNNFFDKEDEQFFDSSEETSEESSEEEREYKQFVSSQPMNSQLLVKIFTRGSSLKRSCEIKTNCQCSEQQRHCKCELDVKRTPVPGVESTPWKFEGETEIFYPETPYRLSELTSDKSFMAQLKAIWGEGSSKKQKVEMKIQGERSSEQIRHLERQRSQYNYECSSPICQYNQLYESSILTDYKIDIDYQLGKNEKQIVNHMYRYLKNYYYSQTEIDQINVDHPEKQVRARITIDPRSRQYVNVTVMTPDEYCKIRDIPLRMKLRPVNIRSRSSRVRSGYEWLQTMVDSTMAKCEVRPRSIKTFDGVRVRLPFSQCYSVLAKDCSQSEGQQFAVMIKKVNSETAKKQMKILVEQTRITLRPQGGEIQVEQDGDVKPCPEYQEIEQHGHVVARIQKEGPYCKVSLPEAGVKVYFDGYAADIKLSQWYQNMQCGLCGHYDGEMSEEREFLNSQYQPVDLPEFARSYLIQEQCQVEEELQDSTQYWTQQIQEEEDEEQDYEREWGYEPNWQSIKSGWCPSLGLQGVVGTCSEECSDDESCQGNKMCCFNGCGHTCTTPTTQGTSSQESNGESRRGRRQPIQRTKVIEQGMEVCFSKDPVPQCPPGTYPTYESEQKVVYNCLSRSGSDGDRAERYHRQSLEYEQPIVEEVQNLPASFTQTEPIPQSCVRY